MTPVSSASVAACRAVMCPNSVGVLAFVVEKGRFDHQRVGVGDELAHVVEPPDVADVDELRAALFVASTISGVITRPSASVIVLPGDQLPALRSRRDAERLGFFDQKGAVRALLKDEAEIAAAPMRDREGADREVFALEDQARAAVPAA